MSGVWHWFVIIGTLGSLAFFLMLLLGNRKTSSSVTTGHEYDGIVEYDNPMPRWWMWLFIGTIAFAVGYLIWYPGLGNYTGVSGWSSEGQLHHAQQAHDERFAPLYAELAKLDEGALRTSRQAQQVGRRLFINNCSTCHGVNGRGAFGFPNLTDHEWIWGRGFEQVKAAITHGRSAAMPGWGAALGDRGVAEVTQYVLQISGGEHEPAVANRGAELFRTYCAACHGQTGTGNPGLGAPDLTNDIWLYGGTPEHIAHTVRHGRNGNMPPFGEILSEDKIHVLSGYVTSLSEE